MRKFLFFGMVVFGGALFLLGSEALAGTSGTEFQDVYDTVTGWTQGGLGKVIAAGAFLVGIAMGVVRQSIMAVVTGISTALAVYYTPTIVDNVVQALI